MVCLLFCFFIQVFFFFHNPCLAPPSFQPPFLCPSLPFTLWLILLSLLPLGHQSVATKHSVMFLYLQRRFHISQLNIYMLHFYLIYRLSIYVSCSVCKIYQYNFPGVFHCSLNTFCAFPPGHLFTCLLVSLLPSFLSSVYSSRTNLDSSSFLEQLVTGTAHYCLVLCVQSYFDAFTSFIYAIQNSKSQRCSADT